MYTKLDLEEILLSKDDCPKLIGDDICKSVGFGNLYFETDDINSFQTIEWLFKKDLDDCSKKLLVDKLQDICDNCKFSNVEKLSSTVQDVSKQYYIITEGNKQIISEDGDIAVTEDETIEGMSIVYHPNGATSGTVPVDNNLYQKGDTVTILGNTGNLVKNGKSFVHWSRTQLYPSTIYPGFTYTYNSNITQTLIYYAIYQ